MASCSRGTETTNAESEMPSASTHSQEPSPTLVDPEPTVDTSGADISTAESTIPPGNTQTEGAMPDITHTQEPPPISDSSGDGVASPADSITDSIALPKSGSGEVFGNRLNGINIVYSAADRCYYLSLQYYADNWEGSTDSVLPFQYRLEEDLRSFEKLSEDSFVQLSISSNRIYYVSGGFYDKYGYYNSASKLICREGTEERVVLEAEVSDYCVDGDYIYYQEAMQREVWRKEMGSDAPPVQLSIEQAYGFQASGGMLFYHEGKSVYMYSDGTSTALCTLSGENDANTINNFLVDGVLLYKTRTNMLFLADGEKIAERVSNYTVYNDAVYYAVMDEGLFVYDVETKSSRQLIVVARRDGSPIDPCIVGISIQNDKLFLRMTEGRFFFAYCIFTADPDGSNFKSLIDTVVPEYQTFTYHEQGFSVNYPLGYTVHFDPGSTYSGCLIMVDIAHEFFIYTFDSEGMRFHDPDIAEYGTRFVTRQGCVGYYTCDLREERFYYHFQLGDYVFRMEGPEEYNGLAESVFLEMIGSFTVLGELW